MSIPEAVEGALHTRSEGRCELCGSSDALRAHAVPPVEDVTADRCVLVCAACDAQLALAPGAALDEAHWFCLKEAAWSPVPAVQVLSLRLLKRLDGAAWAADLLGQLYVDDSVQAWVDAGAPASSARAGEEDDETPTLDSNGARLADGDSVTLIQDLDVKGGGFVAKRGTLVKGIRLTGDPDNIEAKVNKVTLVLKTKFLKKA